MHSLWFFSYSVIFAVHHEIEQLEGFFFVQLSSGTRIALVSRVKMYSV